MSEGFVKKLHKTAERSNIFCMARRVRSFIARGILEIKCYLQSRFPLILYAATHVTL